MSSTIRLQCILHAGGGIHRGLPRFNTHLTSLQRDVRLLVLSVPQPSECSFRMALAVYGLLGCGAPGRPHFSSDRTPAKTFRDVISFALVACPYRGRLSFVKSMSSGVWSVLFTHRTGLRPPELPRQVNLLYTTAVLP